MNKTLPVVIFSFVLLLSGCGTTNKNSSSSSDDVRNISHEDAVAGFLEWVKSADPIEEAVKRSKSNRLGLLCFKYEKIKCPGGVIGVTNEMLKTTGFEPIYIWGVDRRIEQSDNLEKIKEYMRAFNTELMEIIFEEELNNK